ncbi:UDP-N-acetylmuramoyl-L-alanine--D-glutamate ligase [Acetanaerobacterium elongatum]|uniref:UDP-N-acetylmuramoylalanine--D-glutamate ligase n=1 Tax=Acetanaerobacterium elongatum TaxID=258515 RepID=A0A1G9YQV9_9FIRM|nr:UDP-N-acetylmuramoyl-L-alanine--D-glutamate ligase [Acetanaerobacterium elongatum]SDN11534.1 UDP-N-acetylmuramoylalanine--D-glutamate ligase [Acetanaerobacterium elongatum]
MDTRIERFLKECGGKKICFIGIGVSNTDAMLLFARYGAKVTACDKKDRAALGLTAGLLEQAGITLNLGENYLSGLNDFDVVFRTPGMKYHTPELDNARENGVAVTSELEVFFDLCPCPIFAVTGSDGKTTTTTIISELFKRQGKRVFLGGNIGLPLLSRITEIEPEDVAVVELSSFQLISMRTSPHVAVVTNVTPNHLDMHTDMQEYVDAKKNIFLHQNGFTRTVLNLDNDITRSFIPETRGDTLMFSRKKTVKRGAFLSDDGFLCMADDKGVHKLFSAQAIRIPGGHNIENYLAAIAATWGYISPENIEYVARTFSGVEHRIEFVRELDGVRWYNDSIATTPSRTIAGLNAFNQKVILIAGGYDKKVPFTPLAPYILEKVKLLILLGTTAGAIKDCVVNCDGYEPGKPDIVMTASLEEAVKVAKEHAIQGDIVTLSPACASFDMFKNYETRGEIFKELVHKL